MAPSPDCSRAFSRLTSQDLEASCSGLAKRPVPKGLRVVMEGRALGLSVSPSYCRTEPSRLSYHQLHSTPGNSFPAPLLPDFSQSRETAGVLPTASVLLSCFSLRDPRMFPLWPGECWASKRPPHRVWKSRREVECICK
jgi:hypothetical protein